jgi:hypothetical protein
MMRLARLGLLALWPLAAPAEALQINDLRLNCAGVWLEPGVVLTSVSCLLFNEQEETACPAFGAARLR